MDGLSGWDLGMEVPLIKVSKPASHSWKKAAMELISTSSAGALVVGDSFAGELGAETSDI